MKIGDTVYLLSSTHGDYSQKSHDVITKTQVQSIREAVLDGKKQPTEYLVCTHFASLPEFVTEIHKTPEEALEVYKRELQKELDALKLPIVDATQKTT